jgi:magnesium transporter
MTDTPEGDDLAALIRELRSRVPVDAAELLGKFPPERQRQVLAALPADFAQRIEVLLKGTPVTHPATPLADAESVGEIMEPPIGILPSTLTVAGTVDWMTRAEDVSQITYLYVVDEQQRLSGMVLMRDLLLARPGQTLAEIMIHELFRFTPDTPIGEAVRAAVRRHYPVYPVCDEDGRLVGLVRGWQLFERQAVEISAQSGTMVGLDKEERAATPFWTAFRMRHPWLQVNLLTAFLAAFVVGFFEDTITQVVALAAFLPVLAGQSGNSGCQTLAITLRGLTLGELQDVPVARLLRKEILMGAVNGALTGLIAGGAMWWFAGGADNPQSLILAAVILMAMIGACALSGFFGVMVPLSLRRFGADPATASSIFLTTGTDVAGMGLMLFLASVLVL